MKLFISILLALSINSAFAAQEYQKRYSACEALLNPHAIAAEILPHVSDSEALWILKRWAASIYSIHDAKSYIA